jgi:hypothetical protein
MKKAKNRRVRSRRPSDDPVFQKLLATIQARQDAERLAFRNLVESLKGGTPVERAEGCLRFWADGLSEWGDLEAVAYLRSRGQDCSAIIREIQINWRENVAQAQERLIGQASDGSFAALVRHDPTRFLSRFWGLFDSQELSIDATLLRAAQWCDIRGYERWWARLEKDLREEAFSGSASLFNTFNFARSDFAVRDMSRALELSLESIEALSMPRVVPWRRSEDSLGIATHDAAAFAFAHLRIHRDDAAVNDLVQAAINDLRQLFNHESGAWPAFSGQPNRLSIESTAMALHAICLADASDREQFAEPAKEWLFTQQHADGYWFEQMSPDPVWLTVLVLDAIELASDGKKLTFTLDTKPSIRPLVFVAY